MVFGWQEMLVEDCIVSHLNQRKRKLELRLETIAELEMTTVKIISNVRIAKG